MLSCSGRENTEYYVVYFQILAWQNREAMAVALATSLQFIRAEGFVFSHVADEGLVTTACAGDLLRYRESPLSVFKAFFLKTT